ncbi:MAG TPA: hypothetical protein VMU93_12980 [Caulobacteraceae bacterium]|nr:hypothetical protein [Caulobacteraceae bacterium]
MTLQSGRPRGRRPLVAALALAALAAGLILALHGLATPSRARDADEAKAAAAAAPRVSVRDGVVTLELDAAAQRAGAIETAVPAAAPARQIVTAYGAILDAAPLADLQGRYLQAKAQLQIARAKFAVSRAAAARARTLYAAGQDVSQAQLQSAEGAAAVDEAALAAGRAVLATVIAGARQAWGPVLAQALIAGAPLAEDLVERRTLLVQLSLSPGAALAAPPRSASAVVGGARRAPLAFVSPAAIADPAIQGTSYFYETPARPGILPGLGVQASLPAPMAAQGVVAPQSAVVWLQGKAWIYLRTGPDVFVRREIAPDLPGPGGGYIVTGLPPGVEMVVSGAQILLSEEFRAQGGAGDDED